MLVGVEYTRGLIGLNANKKGHFNYWPIHSSSSKSRKYYLLFYCAFYYFWEIIRIVVIPKFLKRILKKVDGKVRYEEQQILHLTHWEANWMQVSPSLIWKSPSSRRRSSSNLDPRSPNSSTDEVAEFVHWRSRFGERKALTRGRPDTRSPETRSRYGRLGLPEPPRRQARSPRCRPSAVAPAVVH